MRRVGMDWTPEMIERLRTLAAEGNSGSAIAKAFGLTRNAIIGKCHRNGIKLRSRPPSGGHGGQGRVMLGTVTRVPVKRAAPAPKPAAPPRVPKAAAAPKAAASFVERTPAPPPDASLAVPLIATQVEITQCRAPLWEGRVPADPAQAMVCGAPVEARGCAWCGFHADRFIAARAA